MDCNHGISNEFTLFGGFQWTPKSTKFSSTGEHSYKQSRSNAANIATKCGSSRYGFAGCSINGLVIQKGTHLFISTILATGNFNSNCLSQKSGAHQPKKKREKKKPKQKKNPKKSADLSGPLCKKKINYFMFIVFVWDGRKSAIFLKPKIQDRVSSVLSEHFDDPSNERNERREENREKLN